MKHLLNLSVKDFKILNNLFKENGNPYGLSINYSSIGLDLETAKLANMFFLTLYSNFTKKTQLNKLA